MPIRVAAIEVSHWHALYDTAYLRTLVGLSDVQAVRLIDQAYDITRSLDRCDIRDRDGV